MPTPPKKNSAYITYIGVVSQADTKTLQINPTIAAGDFKVSIDGGALANLSTLPVVTPAGSRMIKIALTAGEMNGDNITLVGADAAGAEWCDYILNLQTSVRQIDDLAYPTVTGRSVDVAATGEVGLDFANVNAASAPTTLTNITVPTVTTVSGNVGGNLLGTLTTTERDAISDALLNRNMGTGTDSGSPTVRTPRQALRALRNKVSITGSTLVVTKEDDSTPSWSASVTYDASAIPVTGVDPV